MNTSNKALNPEEEGASYSRAHPWLCVGPALHPGFPASTFPRVASRLLVMAGH